jgi:molybdenum cofactor biosynthesis enzyme MoaA
MDSDTYSAALCARRTVRVIANVRPHYQAEVRCVRLRAIIMTKLLEKALEEIAKLPASEQDAVATILLEELASEQRWAELFAKSQDKLARLAEEAVAEYKAGRTKPL